MPTVLKLLGQDIPDHIEGRVLEESSKGWNSEIISETYKYEASLETDVGKYFQEITVSCVGDTKYVDQGNAW